MDAYDDLEKDSRRGQFNALQQLADELRPPPMSSAATSF